MEHIPERPIGKMMRKREIRTERERERAKETLLRVLLCLLTRHFIDCVVVVVAVAGDGVVC